MARKQIEEQIDALIEQGVEDLGEGELLDSIFMRMGDSVKGIVKELNGMSFYSNRLPNLAKKAVDALNKAIPILTRMEVIASHGHVLNRMER